MKEKKSLHLRYGSIVEFAASVLRPPAGLNRNWHVAAVKNGSSHVFPPCDPLRRFSYTYSAAPVNEFVPRFGLRSTAADTQTCLPSPSPTTHTRTSQSHCICKPRRKHTSCGPPVCHWAVLWEGTIPITQWSLPAHGHFNRHRRRRRVQLTHQAGCGCLPLRQHNDNGGFRGTLAHTVRVVSVQIYIAVWHKSINEKGHMKSFGKQRPLQIRKKNR